MAAITVDELDLTGPAMPTRLEPGAEAFQSPRNSSLVKKAVFVDDLQMQKTEAGKRNLRRKMRKGRRTWGNHSLFGDLEFDDEEEEVEPSDASNSGGVCSGCVGNVDNWCTDHNEKCWRGLKHCWFFIVFAFSWLWTSITRVALFVDVFVTTVMFLRCPTRPQFVFRESAFDVFVRVLNVQFNSSTSLVRLLALEDAWCTFFFLLTSTVDFLKLGL
jgi:hypothetical protein